MVEKDYAPKVSVIYIIFPMALEGDDIFLPW